MVSIRKANETIVGAGFLIADRKLLTCAHVVCRAMDLPEGCSKKPRTDVNLDFFVLSIG